MRKSFVAIVALAAVTQYMPETQAKVYLQVDQNASAFATFQHAVVEFDYDVDAKKLMIQSESSSVDCGSRDKISAGEMHLELDGKTYAILDDFDIEDDGPDTFIKVNSTAGNRTCVNSTRLKNIPTLKLQIDDGENGGAVGLESNVIYDLDVNKVSFLPYEPVLCNVVGNSVAGPKLSILDATNEDVNIAGGIGNIDYLPKTINLDTHSNMRCFTFPTSLANYSASGSVTQCGNDETKVFCSGFEPDLNTGIVVTVDLINAIDDKVSKGSLLKYQITAHNISNQNASNVKLKEFLYLDDGDTNCDENLCLSEGAWCLTTELNGGDCPNNSPTGLIKATGFGLNAGKKRSWQAERYVPNVGDETFRIVGAVFPRDDFTNNTEDDRYAKTIEIVDTGLIVSALSGNTNENGQSRTFDVQLSSQPLGNVTVALASTDVSEATVALNQISFNENNWNQAQQVSVTGVDDDVLDGNQNFKITLTASGGGYDGQTAEVNGVNVDNETAGIIITDLGNNPPQNLQTSEDGGTTSVLVKLTAKPTDTVTVTMTSLNADEGAVTVGANLLFNGDNWNGAQFVQITGQDDDWDDGNVVYVVKATANNNGGYNGETAQFNVTNTDNDDSEIIVELIGEAKTYEDQNQPPAQFRVKLGSKPLEEIQLSSAIDDPTEGIILFGGLLIFNSGNWDDWSYVGVKGVDDNDDVINIDYNVIVTGSGGEYQGLQKFIPYTNVDDGQDN